MVSSKENQSSSSSLIYNIKLSSVGPGNVTGQDAKYDPTNMDLAMKLHYLRGVYYFPRQAFDGLTTPNIKESTFSWLNDYAMTCGRVRRTDDSGRPYIKCNDCGMRFIEAQCEKTLEEWLEMRDASLEKLLVSNQVLGPELGFSPLVLMQVTKFKCGGTSVGLSWAHVLGDVFAATEYMNAFGKYMAGYKPKLPISLTQPTKPPLSPKKSAEDPLSVKRVGPVEDHWIASTNSKMEAFSFHVTAAKLSDLQSKTSGEGVNDLAPFETLCAIIWQCIAKTSGRAEPKVVTICKEDSQNKRDMFIGNSQLISVVQADFPVLEATPRKLAMLIKTGPLDERKKIEEAVERDHGVSDFIVYGANLTFVSLEDADLYGLEIQKHKPVCVTYTIDGVGDEGAVLVLPGPKSAENGGNGGRIVTVILPENQIMELKSEVKKNGLIP